ncbi:hypothetical protein PJK45_03920 [Mycobacterium kansasii]|nr:hypothetical protein [Mycobacterium kansasii]ARG59526.1 hypothetical protein B1T43_14585 [Mycobacterium kansasii]ARG64993.1 hypothetical protein B1T45_14945 [Mycobacterium kansasii]ARG72746.1 hypothetical protein B1T47_14415 [Mycobacterium kansasii]ARG78241.1 hypothetical protein B1T51_13920 [Mycobacterium kansasii]ARG83696.1 hypothetical protein B1T52_14205 [Mycobacterium kansasii]
MEPASDIDISRAIELYLKHYPGKNDEEFDSHFGSAIAPIARAQVRAILDQAMRVEVDWTGRTLVEGGEVVKSVMRDRHPELSPQAIASIGHYYTYLMR